jgi:uncharacterized protein with GYD domain
MIVCTFESSFLSSVRLNLNSLGLAVVTVVGTMPLYDVVELLAKELRVNMVKMIIKVDIFFMIVMFYTTLYG